MKGLLFKILGRFVSHSHKVVEILYEYEKNGYYAYLIKMDCHVQPQKTVLITRPLNVGDEFDPHFSNREVIARFRPFTFGFDNAVDMISQLPKRT